MFWLDDYEYEYEARVRNFYNHETWYVSMDEREREREREKILQHIFSFFVEIMFQQKWRILAKKMHTAFESNWLLFSD